MGGALLPLSMPYGPCTQEVWEERLLVKTEGKKVANNLSLLLGGCYLFASCVHQGGTLSLAFLFWLP